MSIDPKIQEYYETYIDLFSQPGWQQFLQDAYNALKQDESTSKHRCKTGDDWLVEQGKQLRSEDFLNFERSIRAGYEDLLQKAKEPDDDDSEELTGDIDEGHLTV